MFQLRAKIKDLSPWLSSIIMITCLAGIMDFPSYVLSEEFILSRWARHCSYLEDHTRMELSGYLFEEYLYGHLYGHLYCHLKEMMLVC